jgi:hypothetical protein
MPLLNNCLSVSVQACRFFWLGLAWLIMYFGGSWTYAQPLEPYTGLHIHNADTTTKWPSIGFQSWRLWDASVAWPNLEPARDKWSFEKLDRYLAMARLTKVEVLLPLGLSPVWAAARPTERSSYGPGNASEPALLTDWTKYVDTVARRYAGRIAAYEIWNEPNAASFFSGSTAEMVKLTCAAYRTIKAADPAAIVLSPAATYQEKGVQWLDEFLSLGGDACVDAVAFHFYTLAHEPPEALIPLVGKVKAVMARRGVGGLPLWNTEAGWYIANAHGPAKVKWKVLDRDEAAAFVARALILGKSLGLARFYWYAWDDGILGLLEMEDASLKPAALAYRTTAQWLQGVNTVKCDKLNVSVMSCELSDGSQIRHVVWSTGGEITLVIPSTWGVMQQRDLIANESQLIGGASVRVRPQPTLLQSDMTQ